ncbi:autotransporter outer membrane beta-barrel domain-containing protein [Bartonella sp. ML69XJBT]|uniref:autotransporter outer membrane beta-barrel domain-containing protein n=1 Tax=Bartonella sp. ML69XJBT TaxID=3019092 RepID=UPI00318317A6
MVIVNILRDYKFLFTFTATAVSFLPIVNINANANSNDFGTPCTVAKSVFTYNDSKERTIHDKTYRFFDSARDGFVAFVSLEKAGTVLNVLQANITVDTMVDQPKRMLSYGMYVKDGGKLVLSDSNLRDISGFRVQNGQVIMNRGKIEGAMQVVCAEGKATDIALATVDIEIASDNLNVKGMGFVSGFGAFVRMSGSTVTFNGSGAFSAYSRGRYLIDATNIKGKGKKYTIVVDDEEVNKLPAAFDIFQGSHVHLRGDSIQLIDMHGFLITNFSGYAYKNGKLIQEFDSSDTFKNADIVIERSNIVVQGKGTYGFYFNGLDPDIWADMLKLNDDKRSEVEEIVSGAATVSLSKTTVSAPDSIAIYSTGSDGYGAEATIELSDQTKISGDLLLKAESNSSILVKADDSILTGGIHVEDISTVDLQLTRGSIWHLKKSKHMQVQGENSIDSSVSSISLSDSTIVFDHYPAPSYQTLRIGPKSDISQTTLENSVYSAKGNVQIKLSAFVNDDGSLDPHKTDRILIYGDVSGITLLQLEGLSKISGKAANGQGSANSEGSQSISLVQVSGTAQKDSFKLLNYQSNDYVAISGLPYQYHLHAYGPSSSYGKADAKNRLLSGSGDFWDFRLESVYINPRVDASESIVVPPVLPASTSPEESAPSDSINFSSTDSNSISSKPDTSTYFPSESSDPVNSLSETFVSSTSDVSAKSPSMRLVPTKISITGSNPTLSKSDSSRSSLSQSSYQVSPSHANSTSTSVSSIPTPFAPAETSTAGSASVISSATDPKSPSVRLVSTKISITGLNSTLSRSDSLGSSPFKSSDPAKSLPANSKSTPVSSTSSPVDTTPVPSKAIESLPEGSTSAVSSVLVGNPSPEATTEVPDLVVATLPVGPPSAPSVSVETSSTASISTSSAPAETSTAGSDSITSSSTSPNSTLSESETPRSFSSEASELVNSLSETFVSSTSDVSAKAPFMRLVPTKISLTGSKPTLSRSDPSRSSPSGSSYPLNPSPANSTFTPVSSIPTSSAPAGTSTARSDSVTSSSTSPNSTLSGSDTSTVSPSGSSEPVNSLSEDSAPTPVSSTSSSVDTTPVPSKAIESLPEGSTSAVSSLSVGNPSSEATTEMSDLVVATLPVESSSVPSVSVETSSTAFIPTSSAPAESSSVRSDSITSSSTSPNSTLSGSDTSTVSPSGSSEPVNSLSEDSAPTPVSSTASSVDTTPVPPTSGEILPENSLSASSDPIESSPVDSTPTLSASSPSSVELTPYTPVKPDVKISPRIRAVVPQLPTYLLLPNSLFYAGLIDLISQNKKLEAMRSTSGSSWKGDEKSAFFVRGYGGSHHYASNLSAFEYGYGADLDYTALEAGVLLKEIESLYSRTFFGFMGTYGSLSLHPQDVKHSKESPFDKWSIASYGNLQHDTGEYMDGVFSYGLLRGDVFTLARGKAATLKGKQFSASLTSGKAFAMRYRGVVFDPQVQIVYQHLHFGRVRDVDHIDVDLGKFSQWTGRIGARLSKTLTTSKVGRLVSFYSMLYFSHSFGDRQFVSFKKEFQLSDLGSPLEVGLGFNARLSPQFVLHGDIIYQHRLTKAGVSGASFSAGLRHLF